MAEFLVREGVEPGHRIGLLAPNGTAPLIERRYAAKRAFDWMLGNRIVRDAAAILAVSSAEAAQLDALGVPARVVRHVPNPIDLDEFSAPLASTARDQSCEPRDAEPRVVYLGRISPRKNVHLLVEAFAGLRTPRARLVIAGSSVEDGARLPGATFALCSVAPLPDEDAARLVRLLVPSLRERLVRHLVTRSGGYPGPLRALVERLAQAGVNMASQAPEPTAVAEGPLTGKVFVLTGTLASMTRPAVSAGSPSAASGRGSWRAARTSSSSSSSALPARASRSDS